MKRCDFYCKSIILAWMHAVWAILRQNRLGGGSDLQRWAGKKTQKVTRGSHRNDVSPLTQGLRYRAACDNRHSNVKAEKEKKGNWYNGKYTNIIATGNSKRQHIRIGSHIYHVHKDVVIIMSVLATVGQVNFRRSGFVPAVLRCIRFLEARPAVAHRHNSMWYNSTLV